MVNVMVPLMWVDDDDGCDGPLMWVDDDDGCDLFG